ncbi:MAG: translational GTPase TypA [Planctomycetota bacterium]|nr:MAG: translational GTPase TypA [Planctomycetota bacterium]
MAQGLRNVAIIAHVDHGKTTLVDGLFRQAGGLARGQAGAERVLDRNDLERERGITILSKNASVEWNQVRINLIDTPGHADFGGQVERVLSMADGCLLLVDAFEGPMPQTRFVLRKAFENHLRPVVVLNKMDRPDARPDGVIGQIYDLFIDLDADDEALDFPIVYASAREQWATQDLQDCSRGMAPLLDVILEQVPAPVIQDGPLQYQVSTLDWSDYVGRIGIGRIRRGGLQKGQSVSWIRNDGRRTQGKVKELFVFRGMERQSAESVEAGDVAAVAGLEDLGLGDTLCDAEHPEALPPIQVDEPTLEMEFRVNDGPFAGREGRFVTSRQLQERLVRAGWMDPALRVQAETADAFQVAGRGLLHLGILIENMRREGYEFCVGKPRVLYKEVDGKRCEPIEDAQLEVPEAHLGRIIEFFGQRGAQIGEMERRGNEAILFMKIPTRGLIGARTQVMTLTKGEGILHSVAAGYGPMTEGMQTRRNGVLVATDSGQATSYALRGLEDRGEFFIRPGDPVYAGMVVGENNKDTDLGLNVSRARKLTNVRSSTKDIEEKLRQPRSLSLEAFLEYLGPDELLEVTPESLRLRKRLLDEKSRRRAGGSA